MSREITIQGLKFPVEDRFSEGHTLSAGEADALNQLLAENLRNNFASTVKKAKEKGELNESELAAAFEKYASEYAFGVRRAGGGAPRITDPVERRAHNLAKTALRAQAKKLNKEFTAEQIDQMVPLFLQKYPQYMEEARRQVEAEKNIATAEVDEDFLTAAGQEQPPTEENTGETPEEEPRRAGRRR